MVKETHDTETRESLRHPHCQDEVEPFRRQRLEQRIRIATACQDRDALFPEKMLRALPPGVMVEAGACWGYC